MKIKLGDKVRSCGGVEGEIVSINGDRHSVMVKVPGIWCGTGIVSIPLVRLTPIAAYTADADRGGVLARPPARLAGAGLGLLCLLMIALALVIGRGGL